MDKQVWNGEGLPPVGTVCEIGSEYRMWSRGEVMYVSKLTIVFKHHQDDSDDTEGCYFPGTVQFRPIRTPEQIEAEMRERVTKQMFDVWNQGPSICYQKSFDYVYDAIRSGKIEGVKIDEHP
ncbi:hypothetical protein [Serratia fonticola]